MASGITTFRVVTLVASSPHNFVTGSTSSSALNTSIPNKGCGVTFQNQSTAAVTAYIGGSDLTYSVGSTSTTGVGGISIAQNVSYQIAPRDSASAICMNDWWVVSTSSNTIVTAQLIKMT